MNYDVLIQSIQQVHSEAKSSAAGAVNRHLVLRNWLIGAYIVEFEQKGNDRADYGDRLLKNIAHGLKKTSVPGSSVQMLERMRAFYLGYPQLALLKSSTLLRIFGKALNTRLLKKSSALLRISSIDTPTPLEPASVLRLSWSHLIDLLRIDDPWKRAFFENECLKGNWSVRQLQRQIGSLLYWKDQILEDGDNPPVGLILCAGKESAKVEYATAGMDQQLFVSRYLVALPKPEELEALIERDQAVFEEQAAYNSQPIHAQT